MFHEDCPVAAQGETWANSSFGHLGTWGWTVLRSSMIHLFQIHSILQRTFCCKYLQISAIHRRELWPICSEPFQFIPRGYCTVACWYSIISWRPRTQWNWPGDYSACILFSGRCPLSQALIYRPDTWASTSQRVNPDAWTLPEVLPLMSEYVWTGS